MSFLAGFAFVLILTLTTIVVLFLADYLPGDFALVPVVFMFGLDFVLVGSYYFIMISEGGINIDEKLFRYGLAASFMMSAFGRSFYLMIRTLKQEKKEKQQHAINFKNK